MMDHVADLATIASAAATSVYAAIAALTLWMLSRQVRDARRFGAAPALYAVLKEMDEHLEALRARHEGEGVLGRVLDRYLEFLERVEHMREAGVLPVDALRRALGPVLRAHLADPRFIRAIQRDPGRHHEVLTLGRHVAGVDVQTRATSGRSRRRTGCGSAREAASS